MSKSVLHTSFHGHADTNLLLCRFNILIHST